jgi:hypothetical protein
MEFLQKAAKETKILILIGYKLAPFPSFPSVKSFLDLPYGKAGASSMRIHSLQKGR